MLLAVHDFSLDYYYVIVIVTLITLGLLCVLVKENNRIKPQKKSLLYLTYFVVACATLSECLGVIFDGNESVPTYLLKIVKTADYILTPMAGAALVAQLRTKSDFKQFIQVIIIINTVFQIISAFTGWMIVVDAEGYYYHGPLYFGYIVMYLVLIALIVAEFVLYGKKFSKQNKASLYLTVIFTIIGILTQELSSGEFRIAYLSLAIGMAMLFIHNNEFAQLKTDESLQEQRVKNMLSQIKPHFIYNSLNAIQAIDGMPKTAQNAIIDFSKYLRENLDSITGPDLVPFEKELEHVKKYVSLEKLRFGEKVKVEYDVKCDDFMLPVLTLQMLVENAIKHGITKRYEGGTVKISTELTEDNYLIVVTDDGVGFDTQKVLTGSHVGLSNIKKRLEHFVKGTLDMHSEIGKGTIATVTIPKNDIAEENVSDNDTGRVK